MEFCLSQFNIHDIYIIMIQKNSIWPQNQLIYEFFKLNIFFTGKASIDKNNTYFNTIVATLKYWP